MKETRPAVMVQTVHFDNSDREAAAELGRELYARLTRPLDDPLAHGAGILVFSAVAPQCVDLEAAETLVLVPVIGKEALATRRQKIIEVLRAWHEELGPGHVLNVPRAETARGLERELPQVQVLTELYGGEGKRRKTLNEIVYGVAQLLRKSGETVQLFISHAKSDLGKTEAAAKQIHDHVVTATKGEAFFDALDLRVGHSLEGQIESALSSGLLVVVRSDGYSSRPWCQQELLLAKAKGLPTLTVEILQQGESRSLAYGGNGPSLVWDGKPASVVSRALVEYVRAASFSREARRVIRVAGLPQDTTTLCRPPELLDLAQGPLDNARDRVAIHPDPELPVVERDILRLANPRLRLLTPTTAFRRLIENEVLANPLDGLQVAMSLSVSPDVGGDEGFTEEHFRDAVAYICRCLISAGGAIGYGGNFREDGYTERLGRLISAYNETAATASELLHNYLGASIPLKAIPGDLDLSVHHLGTDELADKALLPPWDGDVRRAPLYFSDMRRFMAEQTFARVILGGQAAPKIAPDGEGYSGRYPGIVEEAWWTLEAGKPLYIVGGYGGAAGVLVDLIEKDSTPPALDDEKWLAHDFFRKTAEAIEADPYLLDDAYLGQFELPKTMAEMAGSLRAQLRQRLADEDACLAWNGLTADQNRALFHSRDPVLIASLVIEGLVHVTRRNATGKLTIELVRSSITEARDLDAVAVSVFDQIPLGGAGAALDRALTGRASLARADGRALMNLESKEVDAKWLYLASLGPLSDLDDVSERVRAASRDTAAVTLRHGFRRLGVVAFGGAALGDIGTTVDAMIDGLSEVAGATTLVWFEKNEERFKALKQQLKLRSEQVNLTTRAPEVVALDASAPPETELFLHVRLRDEWLEATFLPPAGTGVASSRCIAFTQADLDALAKGVGTTSRSTPRLEELEIRGRRIGKLLFGDDVDALIEHCRESHITVVHDVASSKIPFELLLAEPKDQEAIRPAMGAGLNRRLEVSGVPMTQLVGRPPRVQNLRVLMVVNPTADLDGVEEEAKTVRSILETQSHVELQILHRDQATRQNVLDAMAEADVLRYGGHAFFTGPGDHESGLYLADSKLTLATLRGHDLPVRFAFVNSCETGRVRAEPGPDLETEAAAFAEIFLRSGIEAYLGTYWQVSDIGAAAFAAEVYTALAAGESLDAAVRKARAVLFNKPEKNWGNYLLYGDGRFTLSIG